MPPEYTSKLLLLELLICKMYNTSLNRDPFSKERLKWQQELNRSKENLKVVVQEMLYTEQQLSKR